MNKSTTLKGRRRAASFVLGAMVLLTLAISGCGTCESKQQFDDGTNHYSALQDLRIKAGQAAINEGGMDIFMVDVSELFAGGVK